MKRCIAILLALVMLTALMPITGLAVENDFRTSQAMIDYIKSCEGFMDHAYKALSTEVFYTIGYGHCSPDISPGDTITQEDAEELLKNDLRLFEDAINDFANKNDVQLTQQIFDGVLGLTYNIGSNWLTGSDYRIRKYLKNGIENYPEREIVDAMAVICTSGGNVIEPLVKRRIHEAEIMLYGDYDSGESQRYVYIICDVNGGEMENGNRVVVYDKDKPYGSLPSAVRDGCVFCGWKINSTGTLLSAGDIASKSLRLTALWENGSTPLPTDVHSKHPSDAFDDIGEDFWARDAIDFVVEKGLFNGTSANTFSPDRIMTRGMLVTVLYRLSGSPSVDGMSHPFSDLEHNAYYDAIVWGSNMRIANGWADGRFCPDDPLTRQQLATFLLRYARFRGCDTDLFADLSVYSDDDLIAEYADEPLSWAVAAGIINGTSATTLSPQAGATRAQVATMLMRFVNNVIK